MRRHIQSGCLFVIVVGLTTTPCSAQESKWRPIRGPIVLYFNDRLGGLEQRQFGVFRALDQPKDQFIEESCAELDMPAGNKKVPFLVLPYNLSAQGSYNGFWVRIHGADWSAYGKKDGELVFLLRRLEPGKDPIARTVKFDNTECLSNFKVELKVKDERDRISMTALRRHVLPVHEAQQKAKGHFEIRIPLRDFGLDLKKVHEVVLVFEESHVVPSESRGALGIRAVVVTQSKEQRLAAILGGDDPVFCELGDKAFRWFQKHRHRQTGLVLDRAPNRANAAAIDPVKPAMCSIASVGYFLSLLPEDVRLGRLTYVQAREQAEQTLRFVLEHVEHKDGILFHFVDWRTGRRWGKSEASSLDSAILFNGAMVASSFGKPVSTLADQLLDRANWQKYLVKGTGPPRALLSMGWDPERGLLAPADLRSSENAMPYFLAVGSRTFPIDAKCWYNTAIHYGKLTDRRVLNPTHGLFTSYFGLNWHPLQGLVDQDGVDLYGNAREAALANREVCRRASKLWLSYSLDVGGFWGLSAGDSPSGYIAPSPNPDDAHGIVWPMTALPALPWIPEELYNDLQHWQASKIWSRISGPYGVAPFRVGDKEWIAPDLIGIDIGSSACSIANFRSRIVWDLWSEHPIARAALRKLEFASR